MSAVGVFVSGLSLPMSVMTVSVSVMMISVSVMTVSVSVSWVEGLFLGFEGFAEVEQALLGVI